MRFYSEPSTFYSDAPADTYFAGGGISSLVPYTFTVSIDGRPYMVDLSQPFYRQYHRQIAPLIRTQADTSKQPGEQTMDPNGLWRRSFEDQILGAGQRYLDRETSADNAFWQSKGVDVLTNRWQMKLLPDTANQQVTAATNLTCVEANGNIYVGFGQTLAYTSSLGTVSWTTVTGTPAHNVSSLCTDGNTVYAAYGASGIYSTVSGTASASQYTTSAIGSAAVIGYVNGRLMLGNNYDGTNGDGKLYNIVASGALPTALLAPNSLTNTVWVGFAPGNNFLYAAAQVGKNSLIYGCTITSDGTSLQPPSVQGELPNGEGITGIYGYLSNLIVGSNLGVRFATATSSGVSLGSLISGQTSSTAYGPTSPVQCFYGYGRWVYFGWTNYDTGSTGLGRLDLENFVVQDDLPAFASDQMATAQGAVQCVAVLGGKLIFGVSGSGFFVTSANLVASGTFTSGYILFDLVDQKIASLIDVQTVGPLTVGSYSVAVAADGAAFAPIATVTPASMWPTTFSLNGMSGQRFEVQLTLNRDSVSTTKGPMITRWTLRAYPAPRRPVTWQLPLILDEKITNRSGSSAGFDPLVELQALEQMAADGTPVTYQESNQSYTVFVQDVEFLPDALTEDSHYFNGLALVTLEGLPVPYQQT